MRDIGVVTLAALLSCGFTWTADAQDDTAVCQSLLNAKGKGLYYQYTSSDPRIVQFGQVREPLDILAWAASFEDCMLRPT
jgi:hypothetical protein